MLECRSKAMAWSSIFPANAEALVLPWTRRMMTSTLSLTLLCRQEALRLLLRPVRLIVQREIPPPLAIESPPDEALRLVTDLEPAVR